ncbi:MAG TPA: prolyl oligopeptidase family serine peptidase [Acidisarcina sp.]|nr:prolyl oligopeptidase family serine peptidase [Acidisarcina sp.]
MQRGPWMSALAWLGTVLLSTTLLSTSASSQNASSTIHSGDGRLLPAPPSTRIEQVSDSYSGMTILDSYRWLENATSPETRAWITAQNAYTASYLSQVAIRPAILRQLTSLQRTDTYSVPRKRAGGYYYQKRLAGENQASIYVRRGAAAKEERLVDATRLSPDQNTSVDILDVSRDGNLLVYGVRVGGADEEQVRVLDVRTRKDYADRLPAARYFGVQLSPEGNGLYYARFEHQATTVYFHVFGNNADTRLVGGAYRGEALGEMDLVRVTVTDDGHYLILTLSHGVPARREDILLKDLRQPGSPILPLVFGVEARFQPMEMDGHFYVQTDFEAPKGRIVELTPGEKPAAWRTIVPEGKDVIENSSLVGGKLFVSRLHDVRLETSIYARNGRRIGSIPYPGIGAGSAVHGGSHDREGFYSFESFNLPPTIYRYNTVTGKSSIFARTVVPFPSQKYEVRQVFYTSKDGTRVPMFVAGKRGWKLDGKARVLMTAYGGFNVSLTPAWNPEYAWWMAQGGLFAQPNLRGGGEYGEGWHQAGMFDKKQNVFDDFFAAAEYLIANHYTTARQLAIRGRSNGGLLMGAALTQRPELFGAIWCGYPLLDMLRYQDFLFGRLWTTEYGSAENASDFRYLLAYSPYQNVRPSSQYPAVMFFSGDSDTRVDPLHARKMTALVQAASRSGRPVLLHYSLKGGHSSGVSLQQLVEDQADELAFLWTETAKP